MTADPPARRARRAADAAPEPAPDALADLARSGGPVDARGLRCPLPVVRLAARARTAAAGDVVGVLWTDPAAGHDVPAWARMRGHEVLGTHADGDAWLTLVRIGPATTPRGPALAHDDGGHPEG